MIVDDESDAMLGEMCHIEGVGKKALRYNNTLTRDERDAYGNLILLCSNHHKVIDHDAKTYTVDALKKMKADHETIGRMETEPKDERCARICIASMGTRKTSITISRIQNSNVYNIDAPNGVFNFNGPAPQKMTAPPDAIQNNAKKRAYIIRLRTIYIDTDTFHPSKRTSACYINNAIKKRFGTTAMLVSVNCFDELCSFLKEKIDNSIPGRRSLKERGRPLYDPYYE